ncbi:GntR family transcriptional regulator [Defluviimonas sp. SAOS-178_SWC]|uniref:GntR family transcriptional regulator n=1 Tax=Defluviimonas sp. SAOS-178_SWC TaxID=3121287 RepID=UPI00322181A7
MVLNQLRHSRALHFLAPGHKPSLPLLLEKCQSKAGHHDLLEPQQHRILNFAINFGKKLHDDQGEHDQMKASLLAEKIAQDITQKIATREMPAGEHLRAQALADRYGVSRSPIREALKLLETAGLAEQKTNRGFYVADRAEGVAAAVPEALKQEQEGPYQRIANDWRNDRLPEEVTEKFLRETYALTRVQVRDILARASRDGWAERKPGYGWRLQDVAKSNESFRQIYQFRMAIEPAAMLLPEYTVDKVLLEELKTAQKRMLERDIDRLPVEQLLSVGADFHEELIKFANNPYFHTALVRANQMRRLLEYRAAYRPERFIQQSTEHLMILELLERGEILEASFSMKKHLAGALTEKAELIRALDERSAAPA